MRGFSPASCDGIRKEARCIYGRTPYRSIGNPPLQTDAWAVAGDFDLSALFLGISGEILCIRYSFQALAAASHDIFMLYSESSRRICYTIVSKKLCHRRFVQEPQKRCWN